MNGKMVVSKPLYVTLAQRKEDRRARLQVCVVLNVEVFFQLGQSVGGIMYFLAHMQKYSSTD